MANPELSMIERASCHGRKQKTDEAAKWFDRIVAWVWETNKASMNVLSVTGFTRTGKRYEMGGVGCIELEVRLSR